MRKDKSSLYLILFLIAGFLAGYFVNSFKGNTIQIPRRDLDTNNGSVRSMRQDVDNEAYHIIKNKLTLEKDKNLKLSLKNSDLEERNAELKEMFSRIQDDENPITSSWNNTPESDERFLNAMEEMKLQDHEIEAITKLINQKKDVFTELLEKHVNFRMRLLENGKASLELNISEFQHERASFIENVYSTTKALIPEWKHNLLDTHINEILSPLLLSDFGTKKRKVLMARNEEGMLQYLMLSKYQELNIPFVMKDAAFVMNDTDGFKIPYFFEKFAGYVKEN